MENTEEMSSVVDVAGAWSEALKETAEEDSTVSVTGSRRRTTSSVVHSAPEPKVKASDVLPLVKGVGTLGTRMARVSDLSEEEADGIAEPAAHLLTILAPETPPWAIPLMTLGARVGAVVEARRDEFVDNRPETDATDATSEPEVVEDGEF